MIGIIKRIQRLATIERLSKHEAVVRGVVSAIEDGAILRGQSLPSINQMSKEVGFARMTVDKAYRELKDRGLIESRHRLGFFVTSESPDQKVSVALILYEFRAFQEQFYNVFREQVGSEVHVETFFHHNNLSVFEDIIGKVAGSYGLYVVAPVDDPRTPEILDVLPDNRLLIVDRLLDLGPNVSYYAQEFGQSTLRILRSLTERIRKYDRLHLFFRDDEEVAYPADILTAFRQFSEETGVPFKITDRYRRGEMERGALYATIGDNDLWHLLEDCIEYGLTPGQEVGILSHNESRLKRLVLGGITTWSMDFGDLARRAARFVHTREPAREVVPTLLIDRNSV